MGEIISDADPLQVGCQNGREGYVQVVRSHSDIAVWENAWKYTQYALKGTMLRDSTNRREIVSAGYDPPSRSAFAAFAMFAV